MNATLREPVHKPAGVDRADALDHAGAEVALDGAQVFRRRDLDEHGPELPPAVVMAAWSPWCADPGRARVVGEGASVDCGLPSVEPVRFFDAAHRLRGHNARMYITDARHFLDDKGAMAPLRGPAKAMADFHAGVIAYATDFDDAGVTLPRCFKCKKDTVEAALAQDDAIVWRCPRCRAEGRISNWQGTLWDLSEGPGTAS